MAAKEHKERKEESLSQQTIVIVFTLVRISRKNACFMARLTAKMSVPSVKETPRKRSAHDRAGVTESMEDYLECIFDLESTKGYACVSDVAEALSLNRASTSIMVKRLGKLGFLRFEPYRGV